MHYRYQSSCKARILLQCSWNVWLSVLIVCQEGGGFFCRDNFLNDENFFYQHTKNTNYINCIYNTRNILYCYVELKNNKSSSMTLNTRQSRQLFQTFSDNSARHNYLTFWIMRDGHSRDCLTTLHPHAGSPSHYNARRSVYKH